MNLVDDPWIPVLDKACRPALFSLRDVFARGQEAADADVRPHERVALFRLFACVAHAALDGPTDPDEWEAAPARLPEAASAYLTRWKDVFELFHPEHPFLQIAAPVQGDTPVSKLDSALASGNNATLFDHQALRQDGRTFTPARLALMLLTHQCFALGGGISGCAWRGADNKSNFTDAPCVGGSMAHTLLRGENLLHAVCLNLGDYASLTRHYEPLAQEGEWLGRPVWEMPPLRFADTAARHNAERTCLGRLLPLARAVRLNPNGRTMFYEMGLKLPAWPDFPRETSGTIVLSGPKHKQEEKYIGLRPGKSIWRDLAAVTVRNRDAHGAAGPLCLAHLPEDAACDIVVGGLAREPGKATVLHCPESVFHLPAGMLTDQGRGVYAEAVAEAEAMWRRLAQALGACRRAHGAGEGLAALAAQAQAHYWSVLERELGLAFDLVRHLDDQEADAAGQAWRALLRRGAVAAYDLVCPRDGPRALRAYVLGRQKLFFTPKAPSSQPEGDET